MPDGFASVFCHIRNTMILTMPDQMRSNPQTSVIGPTVAMDAAATKPMPKKIIMPEVHQR